MAQKGSTQWYKEMAVKLDIATDNIFLIRMKQKYNLPMEWEIAQCTQWMEGEIERLIHKMNNSLGITPYSSRTGSVVTENDIKEAIELLQKQEIKHGEGIWGQMNKPWPWIDISKMNAGELEAHLKMQFSRENVLLPIYNPRTRETTFDMNKIFVEFNESLSRPWVNPLKMFYEEPSDHHKTKEHLKNSTNMPGAKFNPEGKTFYIKKFDLLYHCHEMVGNKMILGDGCKFFSDAKTTITRQKIHITDFKILDPIEIDPEFLHKYSFLKDHRPQNQTWEMWGTRYDGESLQEQRVLPHAESLPCIIRQSNGWR